MSLAQTSRDPILAKAVRQNRFTVQKVVSAVVLVTCASLVLYPIAFLIIESLNVGDPYAFPPKEIGLGNYAAVALDWHIIWNTVRVALIATFAAISIGFVLAWILTRTQIPGRGILQRILEIPYYVTPLVGALAWSVLGAQKNGFVNQVWHLLGGTGWIINIYSAAGIAWVMALFEGSVAFIMISAAMRSMDPSLEESSRVLGGSKLRTMLKITLPLATPAVLGATIFVFAEMLGSFAAALILGLPSHFYVITTAIWVRTLSYPPDYGGAAALGISLFAIMFFMLAIYRRVIRRGSYSTITGKAFRPNRVDMGRWTWVLACFCWLYAFVAVFLPFGTLLITSLERFSTAVLPDAVFTLENYVTAYNLASVRVAIGDSLLLGFAVAVFGVLIITVLVWILYRTRIPASGLIEYIVMFPQAIPRMVFGLALLWAWLNIPIPLYGTLWLLGLAYFTVLLPLGVRTLGGVILQVDKSLEECARVCGGSWLYQLRTVTLPLLKPGIVATGLLLFIASVRELGVSLYLTGPNSKVIGPAIVNSYSSSGTELTSAIAVIQTITVLMAVFVLLAVTYRRQKGRT